MVPQEDFYYRSGFSANVVVVFFFGVFARTTDDISFELGDFRTYYLVCKLVYDFLTLVVLVLYRWQSEQRFVQVPRMWDSIFPRLKQIDW